MPAFRVGSTPYGLLVSSSLARWQDRAVPNTDVPAVRGAFETALPGHLRTLLPAWNRATGGVPRVGRSGDADADLVGMLEMDASAREIRVRSVLGATASFNIASFLAADWEAWSVERARLARDAARTIGRDDIASRLYGLTYGRIASLFDRGFVVSKAAGRAGAAVGDRAARLQLHPLDPNGVTRGSPGGKAARRRRQADRVAVPACCATRSSRRSRTQAIGCS